MQITHTHKTHDRHYAEVHFYDAHGRLLTVLKRGEEIRVVDMDVLLDALLNMTDAHNLVHIEETGNIVEVCATISKE